MAGGNAQRLTFDGDYNARATFSPDGRVLAVAGGTPAVSGIVELWSWPNRERLGQLDGHQDIVARERDFFAGRDQLAPAERFADEAILRLLNNEKLTSR